VPSLHSRLPSAPTLVALFAFLFVWSLTTHGKYSVSGDEPHYLMVTQSLVADRDLDVANNYANNDGRLFGHDGLEMGPHARPDRDGRVESVHDPGLPVLLALPYRIARSIAGVTPPGLLRRVRMDRGLFAYSIVSLLLIALTACGVALVAGAARRLSGSAWAVWVVAVAAISPPIASHAFLVFPEVIALFVTAVVVWFSVQPQTPIDTRKLVAIAALLGVLPWMHRKYSFYVLGLLFVVVWTRRDAIRRLAAHQIAALTALLVIPQAAFHLWTWVRWGTLGGPQMLGSVPFSSATLLSGLEGLWMDRQSGLVGDAPIYWLVPICWLLTWRRTWPYLVPALLLYLPMGAFVEWWGGFSPAARYLVPIVPLCLMPIVASLRYRAVPIAFALLCVPQLMLDAVVWQHPRALWPVASATNPALEYLGPLGRAYARLLPMLRAGVN
jgi:hypothetical protein